MKNAEELDVFQKAHELTLELYSLTKGFPKEEMYCLTSQIRRAAVSINTNLMEGSHRGSKPDYRRFVNIARGSAGELKYLIRLSGDLGFIPKDRSIDLIRRLDVISKMLFGLQKAL